MQLVNIFNSGSLIYLFIRKDNGKLYLKKDSSLKPYWYEPNIKGQYKGFDGTPLIKRLASKPIDVKNLSSSNSWESDLNFRVRYLIDKVDKIEKTKLKYVIIDIEVLTEEFPKYTNPIQPISCITVYNNYTNEFKTWYLGDYNEKKLLKSFVEYMQKEKPDLFLGFNLVGFDYPYLHARFKKVFNLKNKTLAHYLSPIKQIRYGKPDIPFPAGMSLIDYMEMDKKITLNKRRSYSLDSVLEDVLGKGKKIKKIEFSKLTPKLKERNREDVKDLVRLENKLQYIPYWDGIRRLAKVQFEDYLFNSRLVESMLLQEAKKLGIVLPNKPKKEEVGDFEGATREVFKTGRHYEVGCYDLSGAYLNAIISLNLDAANLREKKVENSIPINLTFRESGEKIKTYYMIQNKNTLLPKVAEKILKEKNKFKLLKNSLDPSTEEYKDALEKYKSYKSISLSVWGSIGLKVFRYYNNIIAGLITSVIRDIIYYTNDKVKKQGYEIIYNDTDSLIINDNGKDLTKLINNILQDWSKDRFNKSTSIRFDFEGRFKKLYIIALCRYRGWLETEQGLEEKNVGLEIKRKDSPKFVQGMQEELIDLILDKKLNTVEEIEKYEEQKIIELKKAPLEDISFPCKLGRPIEEYKNLPIFIRSLLYTQKLITFNKKIGENYYWLYVKPLTEDKEVKTVIKYKDFSPIILNKDLTKDEVINWLLEEEKKGNLKGITEKLDPSKIKVIHKKKITKHNVLAFDDENKSHISRDMIDWNQMIRRNLGTKVKAVSEALKGGQV